MFGQATLLVSLMMLIFSQSPFGVLCYAILAGDAANRDEWLMYTFILLVQQIGYAVVKAVKE